MGRKAVSDKAEGGDAGGLGSFGALLAARGLRASEPAPTTASPPAPSAASESNAAIAWSGVRRVVLAMTRKGQGGKTVTVLSGTGLAAEELEVAARELKRTLGVGARVEDEGIVVQGDQRERLRPWLARQGVREVKG
jgi:translation initiation factor 1